MCYYCSVPSWLLFTSDSTQWSLNVTLLRGALVPVLCIFSFAAGTWFTDNFFNFKLIKPRLSVNQRAFIGRLVLVHFKNQHKPDYASVKTLLRDLADEPVKSVRSYVGKSCQPEDVRKSVKQRRNQNAGATGSERRQARRVRGSYRCPHGEERTVHTGARAPFSPHRSAGHPAARAAGTPGQHVRYKQAFQKVAKLFVQRAGKTKRMRIHLPCVHVSVSSFSVLWIKWKSQAQLKLHMWISVFPHQITF